MKARVFNCQEVIDSLMVYLENELPQEISQGLKQHLETCAACADYLKTYQQSINLGVTVCARNHSLPDNSSSEMPEQLVQAILAASQRPAAR